MTGTGHRNRKCPCPLSIFTPTHDNAGVSPDGQDRSFHGDDHVRVALIVEQALLAEAGNVWERGQLVVGNRHRRKGEKEQKKTSRR